MFDEYDDMITIEDLCMILSIGHNTAYNLLKSHKLKAFRMGRIWKIPKLAVEDYILSQSGLNKKK